MFKFGVLGMSLLLISGCFSIPQQEQLLSNIEKTSNAKHCFSSAIQASHTQPLKHTKLTLISWNAYKGTKVGWSQDLLNLSQHSDFILLQEAYLSDDLKQWLERSDYNWDMVTAFRYQGIAAGVMTLSRTPVNSTCVQRSVEPWLRLPKSSLISYYPIENSQQSLLVANIHAINFTLGTARFSQQLEAIKKRLLAHQGPIIFAGDFNTWSESREQVLQDIIEKTPLNLLKVEFTSAVETLGFGHRLDHIFFRGIKIVSAEILPLDSSDHYPLKIQFELLYPKLLKMQPIKTGN
ncbi:MAG: endonuclease/exonuclease/phosphatase family protein [Methyloprofundus sp.]|nr:endonuclease/exonuclease/phosphatase family protein [Methyloprofundus sp.]